MFLWRKNPVRDLRIRYFSVLLGAAPAIASTIIFSPVNQLSATISLAFSAVGYIMLEFKATQAHKEVLFKVLAVVMFSASLLAYEISLPLILWACLSNMSKREIAKPKGVIMGAVFGLAPFGIAISVSIIWQKLLAPIVLDSDFSRLTTFSIQSVGSLVNSIVFKFPNALLNEVQRNPVGAFVLAVCIMFVVGKANLDFRATPIPKARITRLFTGLAFLSGFALYAFSGQMSDISSYINRGMTSIWITGILFGMTVCSSLIIRRQWVISLLSFVVAANALWFFNKIESSNAASNYRLEVLNTISKEVEKIQDRGPIAKTILLLDLPCFLPGNEHKIELFCVAWDANGALIEKGLNFAGVYPAGDPGFHFYKENIVAAGVDNFVILDLQFGNEGKSVRISQTDISKLNSSEKPQ